MNELEKIDNYFNGQLTDPERRAFEADLQTDPELADAVAFYLMARKAARKEAIEQRQVVRDQEPAPVVRPLPVTNTSWWRYAASAAAAIVLLVGFGWFFMNPTNPQQLADNYIDEHFNEMAMAMGGTSDSLALGKQAYNNQKFTEAGTIFTAILQREPQNPEALKFAGIVSLRTEKYDEAITYFERLSQQSDLYANPGLFYQALALIKRGQPMDKNQAKKLLQTVVDKNLDGKQEAEKLLSLLR